jgi:hypothetical protein
MDLRELQNRFESHDLDSEQARNVRKVRDNGLELAGLIDFVVPDCREKSLALTALEESVMWANKAVSMHGEPVLPGIDNGP